MIVYNKWDKKPIAFAQGQTLSLEDDLADKLVTLAASMGSAAIGGSFMLQAAKADCPSQTLCGTLVQVQNSAGALAEAGAEAKTN